MFRCFGHSLSSVVLLKLTIKKVTGFFSKVSTLRKPIAQLQFSNFQNNLEIYEADSKGTFTVLENISISN